ncbi:MULTISPECIES: MBOAT family protein [unclassified Fibrobacter]|uniref:MBOAT family O-acyltransferase n=1 Tax=unclassified Fibrobacter TaxID=2634177 RepID=UPI000D6BA125|nr:MULTISPECIES: MBOAT family O-acyltransferase [unclassified Fibrobacter]PWJ71855.1 alginate O-acetyltransferase complex protein AlgI [Fibrobacter sp. UWR4]PZW73770.1 alginate O-acetyltransferase complex protein AlgI [Fibrobacter sp. UWR1]
MVFSSQLFLFYFLPTFLVGYFVLLKLGARHSYLNFFITVFSYIFYGWLEPWLVFLMFGSTLVVYVSGKMISAEGASKFKRNLGLALAVGVNLGALGFFKYYMFGMGALNTIIEKFGGEPFHVMTILLPVGISFYTFQSMSYAIDVWRGSAPPVKNFATFACYVALFPQLVAGPIVRYNTVAEELDTRTHTVENFARGIAFFCFGFAEKIFLANQVGIIADRVFAAEAPGVLNSWWGSIAYMFQIYFDFSAYSNMAIGLGLMLGFHFPRNFNGPYRAKSITEFWKYWHISLTSWFRDYLYIALGGNRVSKGRLYLNLFLVMFASGVWHGANWTFICWGLYHAFFMIVERANNKQAFYAKAPAVVQVLITQVLVLFGWVLFRADNISEAWRMWKSMLGLNAVSGADAILSAEIFTPSCVVFMGLAALLSLWKFRSFDWCSKVNPLRLAVSMIIFVLAILALFTQSYNPFLYFQF